MNTWSRIKAEESREKEEKTLLKEKEEAEEEEEAEEKDQERKPPLNLNKSNKPQLKQQHDPHFTSTMMYIPSFKACFDIILTIK
jgi:hypothetical protein